MGVDTTIVSGFGPWGRFGRNPTTLVLDRLAADARPGLVLLPLPVDAAAVDAIVARTLDDYRPALWVGLGLAFGSAVVAVERIAANLSDFAEPDIAGARPVGQPVVADGPAAYLCTWPAPAIVAALRGEGIPARASATAGTFVCNHLLYRVLHGAAQLGLPTRAGFLHVPAHPALVAEQAGRDAEQPSMAVDLMVRAVEVAIRVARG